jgi:hypothetical protein
MARWERGGLRTPATNKMTAQRPAVGDAEQGVGDGGAAG